MALCQPLHYPECDDLSISIIVLARSHHHDLSKEKYIYTKLRYPAYLFPKTESKQAILCSLFWNPFNIILSYESDCHLISRELIIISLLKVLIVLCIAYIATVYRYRNNNMHR